MKQLSADPMIVRQLDEPTQRELVQALREIIAEAPLFTPVMPRTGKAFSVRMTNCGRLGWVSDLKGYRYQPCHPLTGRTWPAIPSLLLELWQDLSSYPHPPEACLINWYHPEARMGMHQDRDEDDFSAPVLSVSLGDACRFRIGGVSRRDPTRSFLLSSGDVMLLAGENRLAFHGVERIISGPASLLSRPGRLNLTLRRVTQPDPA